MNSLVATQRDRMQIIDHLESELRHLKCNQIYDHHLTFKPLSNVDGSSGPLLFQSSASSQNFCNVSSLVLMTLTTHLRSNKLRKCNT